jgi:hypothetical protein
MELYLSESVLFSDKHLRITTASYSGNGLEGLEELKKINKIKRAVN